ncbi:MAG: hypothetical protein P1U34_09930 [Coxiellaceae bacterium]|nr:hypothetical protein [Coxiellaceae bacterium]
MDYYYHLHGLFFSSEIALPMPAIVKPDHIDVHIKRAPADQVTPKLEHQGVGCQWQQGIFDWYLPSVGRITVKNGDTLYIQQAQSASDDDISCFILGPALAALLIQRNYIPLFGNVVAYDDQHAFALLGNGPCSKSTFSWHCQQAGLSVISDGTIVAKADQQGVHVYPGVPVVRLWHDVCKKLELNIADLAPVRPKLKQYYYSTTPCPQQQYQLTHAFVLQSTRVNDAEIKIAEGLEAFRLLQNHLYGGVWVKGMKKMQTQFQQLTQMAQQVNCQRLVHKSDEYPEQKMLDEIMHVMGIGFGGCHPALDAGFRGNNTGSRVGARDDKAVAPRHCEELATKQSVDCRADARNDEAEVKIVS